MEASQQYGIHVSAPEIIGFIKQRYFVKGGVFDQNSYTAFKERGDPKAKASLERNTRYELHRGYVDYFLFSYVPISHVQKEKHLADLSLERKVLFAVRSFEKDLEQALSPKALEQFYAEHKTSLYKDQPYKDVTKQVKQDYTSKHGKRILLTVKEAFLQDHYVSLREATTPQAFESAAQLAKAAMVRPEPFSMYVKAFYDKEGKFLTPNIEITTELMELIFTTPIGSVSDVHHTSSAVALIIAYIVKQKINPKTEKPSVKKRFS